MNKKIALVLSSGGARGIAHVGVIRELLKRGYEIESIAGSSMGALVGGFYAAGELEKYVDWLIKLDRMDVLRLIDFSISSKGLIKGRRIIDKMKDIIPDRNIEELDIPYIAVATNIHTGEEKVFNQGNLYDAIRASIAIPTVFQPKKLDGEFYVDGGVLNPLPIDKVSRKEGDLLVVSDVNGLRNELPDEDKETMVTENEESIYSKKLRAIQEKIGITVPKKDTDDLGIFNLINKSIGLMLHQLSQLTREKYDVDITFDIPRDIFGTHEFYKAKEIIKKSEEIAKKVLDAYEKRVESTTNN